MDVQPPLEANAQLPAQLGMGHPIPRLVGTVGPGALGRLRNDHLSRPTGTRARLASGHLEQRGSVQSNAASLVDRRDCCRVVCLIGGGIYGFANGDAIDREVRTQKRAEEGASSRLTDKEIMKGMAIALDASNAPAATDVPSLITVQGTEYQARGGTLVVQGDVTSGRKLLLNGQPVPKMTEDLMRLVSVYRYRDRDTALVTYGCGGSGCNWTWFALVEVLTNGQVNVMAGDKLQMDMDGSVPDIAIQSDGSLLVSFRAQQGSEQWRYSKGQITKQ